MLRYFSPLFQSQFQAYANEPEKQQLIIKAVYEFQNNMEKEDFIDGLEDSVDSPKMIDDNEQLYELDAGQWIKIVVGLYLVPHIAELGVFLFTGQQPLELNTVGGEPVALQVEFEN